MNYMVEWVRGLLIFTFWRMWNLCFAFGPSSQQQQRCCHWESFGDPTPQVQPWHWVREKGKPWVSFLQSLLWPGQSLHRQPTTLRVDTHQTKQVLHILNIRLVPSWNALCVQRILHWIQEEITSHDELCHNNNQWNGERSMIIKKSCWTDCFSVS